MADPYNAKDVIIELLRINENKDIQLSEVTFANPVRAAATPAPLKNTSVKITPIASSGHYGIKIFHYDRIHISEVGPITVEKGAATTHEQLLPAINTKYGLYMVPGDIINTNINPVLTGEISVSLQINPNSLTWYSGDVIVTAP